MKGIKLFALVCALAGLAVVSVWGVRFLQRQREERARVVAAEQARREVCERVGLHFDRRPYVALPPSLPHHAARAQLGLSLLSDRRIAGSRWRTCSMCHSPESGGTDQKVHAGRLTRPLRNVVLGSVFLHNGSLTNLQAAIRVMIEDPRYGAGGPLSNVVVRLKGDEKTVVRFGFAFENGLTEANLLESIEQYARTLLTSGYPFDAWCEGRTDALSETQKKGLTVFESHACLNCHDGPALGALKTVKGKKVAPLRGLSQRNVYLSDGSQSDLGAVLSLMPGGDIADEERLAIISFFKTL